MHKRTILIDDDSNGFNLIGKVVRYHNYAIRTAALSHYSVKLVEDFQPASSRQISMDSILVYVALPEKTFDMDEMLHIANPIRYYEEQ